MTSHPIGIASGRSRWRVALLGSDGTGHGPLTRALERAGGVVSRTAPGRAESPVTEALPAPDVVVVTSTAGRRDDTIATVASVSNHYPVVLVGRRIESRLIERASDVGIMACLVLPLRSDQIGPTFDLAIARFRELRDLRQALVDRKAIERAKGLMMARFGLTEEDAYRRLRRMAMDRRQRLGELARELLADSVGNGGRISADSSGRAPAFGGGRYVTRRVAYRPPILGR
jgi:response regulator NasT